MTGIGLLLDTYWDLAYKEGLEGRTHDTEAGDAQLGRRAIEQEFNSLHSSIRSLERLVDDLNKALADRNAQIEYLLHKLYHTNNTQYPLAIDTQEHGI